MADLGNVVVGIPSNTADDIHITSPVLRDNKLYLTIETFVDDIHVMSPIIRDNSVYYGVVDLSSTDDINIKPPQVISSIYKLDPQQGRLTGNGIKNTPTFTINNRPQVSFFGSTMQENLLMHGDWQMEQRGFVTGHVTKKGINPVSRMLRLYHRDTGKLLSETWSDVTGHYTFETSVSLTTPYYIVCFNENNLDFNTIVHDWIIPETS
jgi:hypothetical protein